MTEPPQIERLETVYQRRMISLRLATLVGSDGKNYDRLIEDHGGGAVVLAYDEHRGVALVVRQFRAPVYVADAPSAFLLETMGGMLDGDDPADCARKEAMEEGGVRLRHLEHVGSVWTLPSISTERLSLFLAPYTAEDRVAAGGGADEHEEMDVIEIPLAELRDIVASATTIDMRLFVLVQALQLRRPDLFKS